jgi:hypothetical protein
VTGTISRIIAALAACLASAALAVSLTHTGPRGPAGSQGQPGNPGRSAIVAHLGLCESTTVDISTGDLVTVNLYSPVLTDGVPSCPDGSFVSIVPSTASP